MQNPAGQGLEFKCTLSVTGYLIPPSATQAACVAQEELLFAACAIPYQNLFFNQDSGVTTGISLPMLGSINGVRCVKGPDFETVKEAQYVNNRKFHCIFEATYPLPNTLGLLMSFTESLTFSGGLPEYRMRSSRNTQAQRQLITPYPPFVATQVGSAVGYRSYPQPQPSIWPQPILLKAGDIHRTAPTFRGRGDTGFAVSWSYGFSDSSPLIATPSLWPR